MEELIDQYGHDDSLFISETQDYLHCGICTLVLRDPIMIISCGHKFCSVCFNRMKSFSVTNNFELRCPIDRGIIDINKVHEDIALRQVVGSLLVRCHDHELGCQWTGDLSDMNIHHEQCQYKPVNSGNASLLIVQVKELKDRLDRFELSLFEKEKGNALLKYKQLQLKEEMQITRQQQEQQKQQQQQEMNAVIQKNEVLEQKMLQLEKDKETQGKLLSELSKEREQQQETNANLERKVLQQLMGQAKHQEQQQRTINQLLSRKKGIPFQHHIGDLASIVISKDQQYVEFRGEKATVSAPTGVVPPKAKVWYEVEWTHSRSGCLIIGWATTDLPTSTEYLNERVGKGSHSYGFDPYFGNKWHNSCTTWGTPFTGEKHVFGVALDLVRREILFSVDGKWSLPMGVAFTGIPTDIKLFPAVTGKDSTIHLNVGDRAFKYGPPDLTYKPLIDAIAH